MPGILSKVLTGGGLGNILLGRVFDKVLPNGIMTTMKDDGLVGHNIPNKMFNYSEWLFFF